MRVNDQLFDTCLQIVAAATDVSSKEILGRDKHEPIVFARHALQYVLSERFQQSLRGISLKMNMDDGSALHGVTRIRNLAPNDKRRKVLNAIMDKVALVDVLCFEKLVGCTVVIQHRRTKHIKEAVIEQITAMGDGVKLRLNGSERGQWDNRRDWIILDKCDK